MRCNAEADQILRCTTVPASADRRDTRAGHYERKLETKAGEVKLRVPKLHYQPVCTRLTPLPIEPSRSAIA
jgi:putative transposase